MKRLSMIPQGIVWFLFLIISSFGYVFSAFSHMSRQTTVTVASVAVVSAVWVLIAVICTAVLYWIRKKRDRVTFSENQRLFLECSVFILLFTGGCIFRFVEPFRNIWDINIENEFFQYAQIVRNAEVYTNAHLASRMYVACLHVLFWFLGNIYQAGMIAQFSLLLFGGIFWYFAIRRTFGMMTAMFFVAGAMLLPDSITASIQYTPIMLVFTLYGAFAWIMAWYADSKQNGVISLFFAFFLGICAGLAVLMDISGLIIFVMVLLACIHKKYLGKKQKCLSALGALIGTVVGILVVSFVVETVYQISFANVISIYKDIINGYQMPQFAQLQKFFFELGSHPVFVTAIAAICVFWLLQKRSGCAWIMTAILYLLFLQLMGWNTYMQHDFWIYTGLVTLFGLSLQQSIFEEHISVSKEQDVVEEEEDDFLNDKSMVVVTFEQEPTESVAKEAPVVEQVVYVPKNMEFPKRASKPKIEYAIEVPEENMHFDVSEETTQKDYDI